MKKASGLLKAMALINTLLICAAALYFFIAPVFMVVLDVLDPALKSGEIPRVAWRVHKAVTPGYERWARERIKSGAAAHLDLYDVPGTEWPVFGSVFYLMATENLQKAWEKDNSLSQTAPNVYGRKTIEAARDIIMDPAHHTWVRKHWGENYMHRENVFFRSLIIAGLSSYEKLTGNTRYHDVLKDQCVSLAEDLDKSPHGVLNDYPFECYPIDVLAAIALINRADELTGVDHSEFTAGSVRAFQGRMLDKRGLVPYRVHADTGDTVKMYETSVPGKYEGPSRGIGNSYVLIFAPELWPDVAREWYELYERYFWQDFWWASGWREFPGDLPNFEWGFDVDAGPIIAGFSPAANAFGVAAARVNGRFDHAWKLGAQVLAATWPLPDGSLLGPKVLSNRKHAPYLGEVNLLWLFTQTPIVDESEFVYARGGLPAFVFLMPCIYGFIGVLVLASALFRFMAFRRNDFDPGYPAARVQFALWLLFMFSCLGLLFAGIYSGAALCFLFAQFFPRVRRGK